MQVFSSESKVLHVEITSMSSHSAPYEYIPFGVAFGMLDGESCPFFAVGSVVNELHRCVNKIITCLVYVEMHNDHDRFHSGYPSLMVYHVVRIIDSIEV